jgi:hypothetical protein
MRALRLASLQACCAGTPSDQDLLTRLAKAGQGVYDPFTGLPMLVNLKKGVLYSVGPDLRTMRAHERLDLVAKIPSVAWNGGKKGDGSGRRQNNPSRERVCFDAAWSFSSLRRCLLVVVGASQPDRIPSAIRSTGRRCLRFSS